MDLPTILSWLTADDTIYPKLGFKEPGNLRAWVIQTIEGWRAREILMWAQYSIGEVIKALIANPKIVLFDERDHDREWISWLWLARNLHERVEYPLALLFGKSSNDEKRKMQEELFAPYFRAQILRQIEEIKK